MKKLAKKSVKTTNTVSAFKCYCNNCACSYWSSAKEAGHYATLHNKSSHKKGNYWSKNQAFQLTE